MELKTTTARNSYRYGWLLKRLYPYVKPVMGRVILGFLVATPIGLLDGFMAFALKPYMDYVIGKQDLVIMGLTVTWQLMAYCIPYAVVAFAALQGVLNYLNNYLTDWTSQKITIAIKSTLFKKLVYVDSQFFDDNPSGIIISRFVQDPDNASKGIIDKIKDIITSFFGALGLICVMLYSAWRLAIVGVAVLLIAFLPILLIRNWIKKTSNKNVVITGDITTNLNETYSGNKIVSSYNLQERQYNLFVDKLNEGFRVNIALTKRAGWMSPMMYTIASVGIAIVLAYGTNLIYTGKMTAGGFASFVTSLLLLYKPVKNLGRALQQLQDYFVALGRVFELSDYEPKIVNKENAVKFPEFNEGLHFEHVNFEYKKDIPVLKDINLDIKKGETIAIVGNSGGGKSTIASLVPRFYDIKSGSIKFDNTDVRDIDLTDLRNNIAMVFQDNFLFSGSIRENVMLGNSNATEEDLMTAITAAHLQDMIAELPNGIDTQLTERGVTLSGGQRQRVAIARAMIKNAPIIILDEATSALDNESEAIVQMALDNLIKDKTVLLIAHRFTTIKNADRIAVINEGELVELGTHEELMQIENGEYKHLYEMQFSKNEETTEGQNE
ncbi:ABC transporter ATP-binding protein [bacterium]|nr:ABC transporter ATP-binding protein [bacterium]